MQKLILFVILLTSFSQKSLAGYTLADLEILSQENAYEEFFDHALEVRPSERLEPWKAMVSKMAESFAQSVLKKSEIEEKQFKKAEALYAWPSLKNDDVYKLRRQEIGLRYLKTCLRAEKPCLQHMKSFWEADPTDPDTAIKLSELTQSLENKDLNGWTYLEVALKSPLSEFYCKKDFVMKALWGKLEIDYIRLGVQGDFLKKIDQTIHPDCIPSLNKEAFVKLYEATRPQERELAYQILKSQGKVNPKMEDFFHTVYLLESPSQGELFNYSWNRLKDLGKSQPKRAAVLTTLKAMDPLPDTLFSSMDQSKKKAILNHFKQNFPEYLDLYAHECVDFYSGKAEFPNGNPTIHCQNLMSTELAVPFFGQERVNEFLKAKKI